MTTKNYLSLNGYWFDLVNKTFQNDIIYLNNNVNPEIVSIIKRLCPINVKMVYREENEICHICGSKLNCNDKRI